MEGEHTQLCKEEKSPETVRLSHVKDEHTDLQPRSNEQPVDTSVPPATTASYPSGMRLYIIILALLLGTLLVAIDNTIIGVVIPKVTTVFRDLDDVGWYGSGYLLTVTALQPLFGNFYKSFQVKVVYLTSVVIFEGKI